MCGKGDTYRPVDRAKYDANFEKIFGEKPLKLSRREDYDNTVEKEQNTEKQFFHELTDYLLGGY